ncbi:MAG TPA: HAD family hydrolase [Methylomirabilota bacterium]|nr:HAD family hydrolase [Methylomirabilota bacterium]
MNRRAVFLDRDGVLVEAFVRGNRAYAALTLEEFRLCPDAAPQVERLRAAGLLPIVFTNQPEVARGTLTPATLESMHQRLRGSVAVADIFVCPHDDAADCACRKPRPGMLHAAAARWGLDLAACHVIGDRWRDIEAGRRAGCRTVLLERSYSGCDSADQTVASLAEAVDRVLARVEDHHGLHRALSR